MFGELQMVLPSSYTLRWREISPSFNYTNKVPTRKAVNGVVGQNLMEESFCTNNPPKIQHAKEDAHSQ